MTEGEALVALMEKDLAISRATKALDELPEKTAILQLRRRLKEIEGVLARARAYEHKAQQMVARSADEVASIQAKIDSEQAKVLSGAVTDSKELQNLTRELEALGRRKDALERQELDLMEKAEAGQSQVAKVEAALVEGHEKEVSLIEAFRARGGEVQTEIARLTAERAAIASRIAAPTLGRYEKLRESKNGIAVGVLHGMLCSACRTELPAGTAQALIAGADVSECPNCKRILIIDRPTS